MLQRLKSKTNKANILLASFGILEANIQMLQPLLGDKYGLVFVVVAMVYGGLREVTTKPVAEL